MAHENPPHEKRKDFFFSLQEAIIKKLPKQGLNKTQVTEKKQKNREGEGDVEKQACVAC